MDYQRIYNSLVYKRTQLNPLLKSKELYTENHHIIPRCLNGTNDSSNMVRLTAREHFIAHLLLHKIYPDNSSLLYAIHYLSNINRYSSKEYEWLKIKHSKMISERMKGANNPNFGKTASKEMKDKMSKSGLGSTKNISEEVRLERSERMRYNNLNNPKFGNKGSKRSEELNRLASERMKGEKNPFFGKKMADESKLKSKETNNKNVAIVIFMGALTLHFL